MTLHLCVPNEQTGTLKIFVVYIATPQAVFTSWNIGSTASRTANHQVGHNTPGTLELCVFFVSEGAIYTLANTQW